jgi:large subunit ribosomal protein L23
MKDPRSIVRRAVVTEKAQLLQERRNQFVFDVDKRANKIEIKRAIETLWDVKITSVRTMHVRGKQKSLGYKHRARGGGFTPSWKKAVVTVAQGDYIDVFDEGGADAE